MIRLAKLPSVTPEAAAQLVRAVRPEVWPELQADIEAGRAELFACPRDTYGVLRVDGRELVVAALAGEGAEELFGAALNIARANALERVRFHTQRKGLARLLKRYGPVEAETVYTVTVQ